MIRHDEYGKIKTEPSGPAAAAAAQLAQQVLES